MWVSRNNKVTIKVTIKCVFESRNAQSVSVTRSRSVIERARQTTIKTKKMKKTKNKNVDVKETRDVDSKRACYYVKEN